MTNIYVTKNRYKELEKELEQLKGKGRRSIASRLKEAKELGDLSENSEYQEAREEQLILERRIHHLERVLRGATIIHKKKGSDVIEVGSFVKVQKGKNSVQYTIVGSDEADPKEGKISNESPLGRSLLGRKVGDHIEVDTPKGKIAYHIIGIE